MLGLLPCNQFKLTSLQLLMNYAWSKCFCLLFCYVWVYDMGCGIWPKTKYKSVYYWYHAIYGSEWIAVWPFIMHPRLLGEWPVCRMAAKYKLCPMGPVHASAIDKLGCPGHFYLMAKLCCGWPDKLHVFYMGHLWAHYYCWLAFYMSCKMTKDGHCQQTGSSRPTLVFAWLWYCSSAYNPCLWCWLSQM